MYLYFSTMVFPRVLIIINLLIVIRCNENSPIVSVNEGKLRGKLVIAPETNAICQAYLGVPFAEPPLDDLRFAIPKPAKSWEGVRQATGPYNICASMPWGHQFPNESEDCLYLHIVTTERIPEDNLLPVLVWIHGGGFIAARSAFTPEISCQNLVTRGVVVVAIQYRVGYLGFLATGDNEATGNYGLYDQIAALKWINENIAQFGGDPTKVTVWGGSAGAVSASFMSYLPEADHYVHQTICQSGSPYAFWGFNRRSVASFPKFAMAAGCMGEDQSTKDVMACLRKKSLQELQDAHFEEFGIESYARRRKEGVEYKGGGHDWANIISFNWGPRVDGKLIPSKNFHELPDAAKKPKPTIIGATQYECLLFARPWQFWPLLWEVTQKYRNYSIPYYIENEEEFDTKNFYTFLKSAVSIFENRMGFHPEQKLNKNKELFDLAKDIYLNQDKKETKRIRHMKQMLNICSDFWINIPVLQDAENKRLKNWDVFLYNFDYNQFNYPEEYLDIWTKTTHGNIATLIWSSKTPKQIKMREIVLELWTNFVKYGHPTPWPDKIGFEWPKFESMKKPVNLRLNLNPEKDSQFHYPSVPFWTLLAPEIKTFRQHKTEL